MREELVLLSRHRNESLLKQVKENTKTTQPKYVNNKIDHDINTIKSYSLSQFSNKTLTKEEDKIQNTSTINNIGSRSMIQQKEDFPSFKHDVKDNMKLGLNKTEQKPSHKFAG